MPGIILDLDDTLYPRAEFLRSGFDAVARYVAHSWRLDRAAVFATLFAAHAGGRTGKEFQVLCEEHRLPQNLVPVLINVFRTHAPSLGLSGSVRRTLVRLRQDGWRLVILTNGAPDVQRRKVAALGLAAFVDAVIYAEEHAPGGKPHPAAFQAALCRLDAGPDQSICIGDDPICDIEGARKAGLRTIRMRALGKEPIGVDDADLIVSSMTEVPALARTLLAETADAA